MIPLLFVLGITLLTVFLGMLASGGAKGVKDFFVAGRGVGVGMNASAISGEYLSAASFMGIAGLVMKNGYDALWYPVGYAAGYLFLLLFIAGPLRRFGAYTIPDFAEGRFDSPGFRRAAVLFVLCIGFFYTMPQMKGAGVTMGAVLGWPYWAGIVAVGAVITFNVALGGMKGITLVQAFQYWAKLFAISVPLFVLAAVFGTTKIVPAREGGPSVPTVEGMQMPSVAVKGEEAKPANAVTFSAEGNAMVEFPEGAVVSKITAVGAKNLPDWPENLSRSVPAHTKNGAFVSFRRFPVEIPAGTTVSVWPYADQVDAEKPTPRPIKFEFARPTKMTILGGSPIPNAPTDMRWQNPFGPLAGKNGYPLLWTYSLIVALVCGTAGLPHILVRFYTNPDGRAAKRTTLWVMVLLGLFYVFTPVWGTLARAAMPILYANNATDSAVLKLPTRVEGTGGQILAGVTAAGAFAAFMSTFSGLLVSMSGAFAHDVYGKILRPGADEASRLRAFKIAAIAVGIMSIGLGLLVESFDIATMVGWAFAIGAASYFPLLLLGAWWRGLTAKGAKTGMLVGGLASLTAIVGYMLLDKKVIPLDVPPLVRALMEQPAIWGVPLSIATMVLVSRASASEIPSDVDEKMLRLHAPEELGLSRDYVA